MKKLLKTIFQPRLSRLFFAISVMLTIAGFYAAHQFILAAVMFVAAVGCVANEGVTDKCSNRTGLER